jgi:hypothetical protein
MAGIKPLAGFERQPLDIEIIPSGRRFGRIYAGAFPDPLGFGKTASRFSDPRRRDATRRFGVLYLGETLKVCFLEAVLCDRRDGLIGDLPIDEKEIYARRYAEIETIADLSLTITPSGWVCQLTLRNRRVRALRAPGRLHSTSTSRFPTGSSIHLA